MPLIFQRRIGIENRPVGIDRVARLLNFALAATGLADASGMPLTFTPHDFRRIFTTEFHERDAAAYRPADSRTQGHKHDNGL